jgi:hypothetical protein
VDEDAEGAEVDAQVAPDAPAGEVFEIGLQAAGQAASWSVAPQKPRTWARPVMPGRRVWRSQ